jgi:hypothetical protein
VNPMIAAAFRAFDDAGVSWCLVRGEAELDAPDDVDLLVSRRDFERLGPALRPFGFAPLPSRGHGPHSFFLAYDSADGRWIKLDVVTELSFGPDFDLRTGVEEECLARRHREGALAVLDADSAFWALLLHCLLDKQAVASRHRHTLARLAAKASPDGPLGRVVDDACPAEWTPSRIVEAAARQDWPALLALGPLLESRWPRRGPAPSRLRRKAARVANRFERPGLSVALLAPDGAGKTTLAASLEDSFYFPVRTVYMGLDQRPPGSRKPGRRAPGLGLARRLATVWSRYLAARLHESRGGLVVFDRYTYDALLPPRQAPTTARRARRWILAHACPAPDLVLVLDAPGEVLHARKPEHPQALLEEQRDHYRRLGERLERAVVVDAARETDEVRREVESVIWRALAARIARD